MINFFLICVYFLSHLGCTPNTQPSVPMEPRSSTSNGETVKRPILTGAEQPGKYLPILKQKNVALVVNQTSMVVDKHLVDYLLNKGIHVKVIFAPEHGFRGEAADGAVIHDGIDPQTQTKIISLYGNKRAPSAEDLKGIDIVVFDIQDVGARFYTFLSTLKYVMEACATNHIPLLLLDRPNPNGHYIDGPLLDPKFTSFVGIIPIPVVHGMTLGELAGMMNGQGLLKDKLKCDLGVIPCADYSHSAIYTLPVKPSPNLPNDLAIALYPSLCFFEATNVSVGRGTDDQFQIYGSPYLPRTNFSFTPTPNAGSPQPPLQGKTCYGSDLTNTKLETVRNEKKLNLNYLLKAYKQFTDKSKFFLPGDGFERLAGTAELRKQIIAGKTEEQIRASWQKGIEEFRTVRSQYLLYPD